MPVQFLAYFHMSNFSIKEQTGLLWPPDSKQLRGQRISIYLSTDTFSRNLQRNMHLSLIPLCGLLLISNLQLFSTYPISTGLTDTDMNILKVSGSEIWLQYGTTRQNIFILFTFCNTDDWGLVSFSSHWYSQLITDYRLQITDDYRSSCSQGNNLKDIWFDNVYLGPKFYLLC